MRLRVSVPAILCLLTAAALMAPAALEAAPSPTCSTFQLSGAGAVLVGHNLDDSIETPGFILVNPRGVPRTGPRYRDLFPFAPGTRQSPEFSWTSRYGSITCNVFGREFPDGGMNEAGLYVGEMTLLGTVYPMDPAPRRLYHHSWIQYLLDSFATVPEVLDSLSRVVPEGHCQWHFFAADREGRAAVVEFLEGRTVVRAGDDLPWKLLTNSTYAAALEQLPQFEGFGGGRTIELPADCQPDLRFVWAASRMREIAADPLGPTVDQALALLAGMWCGVNRISLVFDPLAMRVYWTTYRSRTLRWVDFASFGFSCASPQPCLDMHRDVDGDASAAFVPFTDTANLALLQSYFRVIDAGFWGNLIWKPAMVKGLQRWQKTITCPE